MSAVVAERVVPQTTTGLEAPLHCVETRGHASARRPVLEVKGLGVQFRSNHRVVRAVDELSFELLPARTLAIIGESGSGKSTSCRALMGLLPATAAVTGSVLFDGKDLIGQSEAEWRRYRGARLAMVFQDADQALNPTMRVGMQIEEALRAHESLSRRVAGRRALELLWLLRVPMAKRRLHSYPHELSGGMRQRVMIAMALSANPQVLIADEAARSLDLITQAQTMALLMELRRQLGLALIMVSHDLRFARRFADDVIVMYAGRPVEQAPAEILFTSPRMPYTKALLDAIPTPSAAPHSRFRTAPGHPPEATSVLRRCAFAARCASALADCLDGIPPIDEEGGRRWACRHPLR